MNYNNLEKRIYAWAKDQDDVLAVVVIGSRARTDHPADEWSDLDLILFVADPKKYSTNPDWLSQFGEIWLQVHKITGIGDQEWLVLFAGGFKADFLIAAADGNLAELLFGSKYAIVTQRGVRVLLDKQGDLEIGNLQDVKGVEWHRPDEAAFTGLINQFWLSIYRAANMIQRGDLWRTRMIFDNELHRLLLRMLEWHAKAIYGSDYDVWYDGRFLVKWADPQAVEILPELFAPIDEETTGHALLQMMALMDRLGMETVEQWGYHYPVTTTARVRDWIVMSLNKLSDPDLLLSKTCSRRDNKR